ncbi:unnamed protein product [Sphagnum tenellum]
MNFINILMKTFRQFIIEIRDVHKTIANLHALAYKPGTPEEGNAARAAAERLMKKHGNSPSAQFARKSSNAEREWKKPPMKVGTSLYEIAKKHGFEHIKTVEPGELYKHGSAGVGADTSDQNERINMRPGPMHIYQHPDRSQIHIYHDKDGKEENFYHADQNHNYLSYGKDAKELMKSLKKYKSQRGKFKT